MSTLPPDQDLDPAIVRSPFGGDSVDGHRLLAEAVGFGRALRAAGLSIETLLPNAHRDLHGRGERPELRRSDGGDVQPGAGVLHGDRERGAVATPTRISPQVLRTSWPSISAPWKVRKHSQLPSPGPPSP
jgi:hypothetical protein